MNGGFTRQGTHFNCLPLSAAGLPSVGTLNPVKRRFLSAAAEAIIPALLLAALIMNATLKLGLPLWAAVVLGAVGAVLGEIGDLSFSIIKRQTGIKDYGHIFPGHGGVLDRFDSVIFVAPFAEFLFRIVF